MSRLTLHLPETLHRHLENLARRAKISLNQYIVYAVTRQATLAYYVQYVAEEDTQQQSAAFAELLESLGRSSLEEAAKILQEREIVKPEADLDPELVKRLQDRIAGR
jgi:hypothetical protein